MTIIYVTKYALSSGPFKVDAEVEKSNFASYKIGNSFRQSAHRNEFFLTEEDALADCERRRDAKLKSIEKQKAKLKAITFTFKDIE